MAVGSVRYVFMCFLGLCCVFVLVSDERAEREVTQYVIQIILMVRTVVFFEWVKLIFIKRSLVIDYSQLAKIIVVYHNITFCHCVNSVMLVLKYAR
jgi:hypothetical protein